jgi:acyl-CoA synthetase (NDP forming)
VDSVVVLLGADKVLPVLEKAVETRVEAAWVLASGFGEAGEAILPPFSPIANPLDARGSGDLEATYPACVGVVSHEVEQSLAVVKAAVEATSETRKPVLLFSNLCAGFNPQVVEAAQAVGYPVVLKILSPDIHHKTEIGGVRVGLGDEAEVRLAFRQAMAAARERHPGADLQGVLIQEMIGDDAVEVIVGVLKDADFGPVIVFGLGGILVELFEDPSLRLPPLSRRDAREMIEKTQAARLLAGFRERPPADVEALVDVLVRVSQLAVDLKGQIAALDINPLMVLPQGQGVRAVDASVEIA